MVRSVTVGLNTDHTRLRRSADEKTRSLLSSKRSISRPSWANAFTTRTPLIASVSTLVNAAHAAAASR